MSDYLAGRIERHEKIDVIRHVEVDAVEGNRTPTGLRLRKLREGGNSRLDCSAVFVFIGAGHQPRTGWLPPSIAVYLTRASSLTGADAVRSYRWPLTNREPCTVEQRAWRLLLRATSGQTPRSGWHSRSGASGRGRLPAVHRVLAEL